MLLSGCEVSLQVNYFGFDDANTMFDGLWGGSDSLAQDWATIVYRIQLLGFNAVRIPFSFKDLQASPKDFSQACTQVENAPMALIQQSQAQCGFEDDGITVCSIPCGQMDLLGMQGQLL